MTYTYYPQGTCSKVMNVEIEDGIVKELEVIGGCSGNLQGISRLVEGMPAEDAIARLRGIRCGFKPTSCPDQLSIALEKALEAEKNM
ncbi:MAG: TIGR03905 family TSCPD domain-containing protein [Eubacteriales bacterium]|nr:TIGR03905 family TSCPD domain-containing protein [Eubacteriales bacterium]